MAEGILTTLRKEWKKSPEQRLAHKMQQWHKDNKATPAQSVEIRMLREEYVRKSQELNEEYSKKMSTLRMKGMEEEWEILHGK